MSSPERNYEGFQIGNNSLALLPFLPSALPEVTAFDFLIYEPSPSLRERLETSSEKDVRTLIGAHHKQIPLTIPADQMTEGRFRGLCDSLESDQVLGLCSRCRVGTTRYHLPLMDFRLPISAENQSLVLEAMGELGRRRGLLLDSGNSYHFIGLELLSEREFVAFLGGCLLLDGMADTRYIGHRLVEMTGVLRLTSSPRKPAIPTLLARL